MVFAWDKIVFGGREREKSESVTASGWAAASFHMAVIINKKSENNKLIPQVVVIVMIATVVVAMGLGSRDSLVCVCVWAFDDRCCLCNSFDNNSKHFQSQCARKMEINGFRMGQNCLRGKRTGEKRERHSIRMGSSLISHGSHHQQKIRK